MYKMPESQDYSQFRNILNQLEKQSDYFINQQSSDYRKLAVEMLNNYKLIELCSEEEKKYIFDHMQICHYFSGQTIYRRNQSCDEVIFVLRGTIQMGWYAEDGKQIIHRFIPSGFLLNIIYLISQTKFEHDYIAYDPTTLITIPGDIFKMILKQNSKVLYHVFEVICLRNRLLDNDMYHCHTKSLRAQLARQFLYLMENFSAQTNQMIQLSIRLSQENFADLLKTSRQSIRKEISWFVDQEIIENKYNKFYIKDPQRLRELV
ncbi:Crp/Fnr family transcriptional regulator [Acinetobacter qingfengensis]|uniref:Cyclic nucleotide-binding domain-containing protein n=1 Tax=Acinetobacter qingfengensis TaxID=1262585 RepID=A0A1E7R3N6_9GAMM|nr:Crp/Fnr family transcriptional regulator [Acinetobacter qingfengensis]KAA8735388.1 Crp/Fnr family transcriptional regulator [Acinetobacter qingfengensis]OEY93901.1 hypothetical protein BJI46_13825 [Acinetobacter qingfengensis]